MIDPISFERVVTGGVLASLAIAIAFGPELRRVFARMRSRRAADVAEAPALRVESQQF